jgi:thioesterase domain-containing protein
MQAIWQQILRRPRIGVTEDFFDLGGQSFDAIRIFARLKEEYRKNFTLSDMWGTRSIRKLAEVVGGKSAMTHFEPLVRINRVQSGAPLFIVHPAGGSVMAYSALGRLIDRPLFGIQAPRGAEAGSRRRDVVRLAAEYVACLRKEAPQGPYSLAGWSSGAMIAFEMAAELERSGAQVEQLFLLDGPLPVAHENDDGLPVLEWFLDDLALGLATGELRDCDLTGKSPEQQLRAAAERLGLARRPEFDEAELLSSYEIFRDLIHAGCRYRPPRIAADLTVVRVTDDIVREFSAHPARDSQDWGWGDRTSGDVRCIRVPGNHHTFLTEPLARGWHTLFRCEDQFPLARQEAR